MTLIAGGEKVNLIGGSNEDRHEGELVLGGVYDEVGPFPKKFFALSPISTWYILLGFHDAAYLRLYNVT